MKFAPKKFLTAFSLIFLGLYATWACELSFWLTDNSGASRRVLPGSSVILEEGSVYTLKVEFFEDHRNCLYEPEATVFLLDSAKWRVNKEDQGLVLTEAITWTENSRTMNTTNIVFMAKDPGSFDLNILRDCEKGGYDEHFTFVVQ